ncbi:RNA polymerase I-specific transcription-initiation factor-domain-containing protein [Rhodofomes roseus]|uniref:RNA polymerase I-specific transcription-initiation factor-domain-containing protein n=1 Tax=Rhodofomes roseus TaxID=34475 RepID=A0ABQ8KW03_9APHY|nr:RNA polymerase I-specific transcription-initiation factor-domain-containing protein [Rhodofomes roseus]KAH9843216.1 RNA polymerase I-specific transcription-initiation factor-domain-containing protein [Rhodofomes roseus]
MDRWPTDDRDTPQTSENTKGRKSRDPLPHWTYPVVEHGSLSAAALHQNGQRLEWSFIVQENPKRKVVPLYEPVQAFPETLQRPFRHDMSVSQRADQGVQFLRTYYPDFEMSAELVRDEIAADVRATQSLQEFDPYRGSMLETFTCARNAGRSLTCLAFPMGDSYLDLNISPVTYSRRRNTRVDAFVELDAVAKPIRSFETPIQQLKASALQSMEEEDYVLATVLGVRTMGSTTLLDVRPTDAQTSTIEATELVNITHADLGNRPIADMILPATERTLSILVNDSGSVYKCAAPGGQKSLQIVHVTTDEGSETLNPGLWKVATWDNEDSCLLMSERSASCLDFRTEDSVVDLYHLNQSGALLTSIESHQKDGLIRLVTTNELLWIDIRSPKKPLLGVQHFRNFDRTLQSHTRILSRAPMTYLTSQRNGLISVYDVSRSGSAIQMASPAYYLPPMRAQEDRNLGHVFLQHPHSANTGELSVLQLSELGAVHTMHLKLLDDTQESAELAPMQRNWSEEIEELDEQVKASGLDDGPLGARTFSEADFRPAYQRLFMEKPAAKVPRDAVYDLLDKMPIFWQEVDAPVEHALTTFDIAYRCGPEPSNFSRNDLFTESVLNSKRGYRALKQGRIPVKQLARKAPWHQYITPFVQRQVVDLREDPAETLERLTRYDLSPDGRRPAGSLRREAEAREQLTLDLHLSTDVFSPSRFRKPHELDIDAAMETMSRATEAMTLSDMEPSDVQFGFLHPARRESNYRYTKDADTHEQKQTENKHLAPLGVRLLLKEWDVGGDPSTYRYEDPYDTTAQRSTSPRWARNAPSRPVTQIREGAMQSQRPPLVVPTAGLAPPTIASSQPFGSRSAFPATQMQAARTNDQRHIVQAGSQPADDWDAQPSSQIPFASTQVLPGPHGGRPGPAKKKSAKKRVGGF